MTYVGEGFTYVTLLQQIKFPTLLAKDKKMPKAIISTILHFSPCLTVKRQTVSFRRKKVYERSSSLVRQPHTHGKAHAFIKKKLAALRQTLTTQNTI